MPLGHHERISDEDGKKGVVKVEFNGRVGYARKSDIQELSYQEIADTLRLPEGTVKSRINRGRTELARQIRRLRGADFGQTTTVLKRTGVN